MKMTYLDLLKAVSEGTQPRLIKYATLLYTWDGNDYVCDMGALSECRLSSVLEDWTTKAQTTADFIEVISECLTEKEKEYLKAVIKPFTDQFEYISKYSASEECECLKISLTSDNIYFPYFSNGKYYRGMELDKKYSLEELGL